MIAVNSLKLELLVFSVLSMALLFAASAHPQDVDGTRTNSRTDPSLEVIEILNVNYILPKGTKFRKRAGVITFEGAGEYSARRLHEMEQKLRSNEMELRRLEKMLSGSEKPNP